MPVPQKACPVVLRQTGGGAQTLAFRHPQADCQWVKGSIEPGESITQTARRELFEESSIDAASCLGAYLGTLRVGSPWQDWHFVLISLSNLPLRERGSDKRFDECRASDLKDTWTHRTADGGSLDFTFFWHPLDEAPGDEWHPIFRQALSYLSERFAAHSTK